MSLEEANFPGAVDPTDNHNPRHGDDENDEQPREELDNGQIEPFNDRERLDNGQIEPFLDREELDDGQIDPFPDREELDARQIVSNNVCKFTFSLVKLKYIYIYISRRSKTNLLKMGMMKAGLVILTIFSLSLPTSQSNGCVLSSLIMFPWLEQMPFGILPSNMLETFFK